MSKQFKKLSHTIYDCKYHIVCCPKYRHRIFKDGIKEYTKGQIYILCRQKELVELLELNVRGVFGKRDRRVVICCRNDSSTIL